MHRFFPLALAFLCSVPIYASEGVRFAPRAGITPPQTVQAELQQNSSSLGDRIAALRQTLKRKPELLQLLPDVEIFQKAVEWPLLYGEFYRSNEFAIARTLLKQGLERADALASGQAPWINATGLVVRGYLSKIDGSVQPYGLVVPATWRSDHAHGRRLDVWLHGRDDHLTELKFISDRQRSYGEFAPPDSFILHPYGRYCNAFKFAGEVDVFEAMEHVRTHYAIDPARMAIRGFSMGGAGCWHLAVHHPGSWAAASPGAGFVETAIYTKALLKNPKPPWYEQSLWHLYDSVDYAENLFNCPTVAYSGEIDPQKQAADMMAQAMKRAGLDLVHVIGPNTAHKYEPRAKAEVASKVDALVANGRDPWPKEVRFTTWSLRYPESHWVRIEAMDKHWEPATIHASAEDPEKCVIFTTNIAELTVRLMAPQMSRQKLRVDINGETILAQGTDLRGVRTIRFRKKQGQPSELTEASYKARIAGKRPQLQGPIDDAFMNSFLVVRPTGEPMNAQIAEWTASALARATNEWRSQFRGLARVKNDADVTAEDIAANNLVLWGDPKSNRILGRIANKMPLVWNSKTVRINGKSYDANGVVPVMIYPNPLNPDRYVVWNTGFTFADRGAASNAQQTPKLPDWAVLSLAAPSPNNAIGSYLGAHVLDAGFFDESWQLSSRR